MLKLDLWTIELKVIHIIFNVNSSTQATSDLPIMAGTQVTRQLINNHGYNNLKRIIHFFFGFSLYFFNGSIVIAQESLEPLELLTNPTPIFSEQQKNGRMSGYGVEYAKSVFQLAGYKPNVTPLPFARLIKQINKG